jgi:nucleotide sugar dehydrogenase
MKKIAIIGHGVVGKGMEKLFKKRFDVRIYDVVTQPDKSQVENCDLAIICVPTNELPDGSADTQIVEDVLSWVEAPLILIKSTVPPETTDRLAQEYNKNVCFSPEYMGESKYFTPFWKYPDPENAESHSFVIIGGEKASDIASFFMKVMSVDTVYSLCSAVEAELTKYMENCFFATKVTFCNEFYNIAKMYGVDYKSLRENWLLDPRINRNHTLVFDDERGYGGKCFPKDMKGIISASEKKGYEPTLLKAVVETNKRIRND